MILAKSIGVLLLILLALIKNPLGDNSIVVILSYLMYVIFTSATDPLEESLFMDYSPRRQRARWMSLDSVVEFGSSASAVLGGVLSDKYSYQVAILASAIIQSVGIVFVVVFLLPIVPWSEEDINIRGHLSRLEEEESLLGHGPGVLPNNDAGRDMPLLDVKV